MLSYTKHDIQTPEAQRLNLLAAQRSLVLIKNGPGGRGGQSGGEASPAGAGVGAGAGAGADDSGTKGSHGAGGGGRVLPLRAGSKTAVLGPHYNASWVLVQPDTGASVPSPKQPTNPSGQSWSRAGGGHVPDRVPATCCPCAGPRALSVRRTTCRLRADDALITC